MSSYESSKAINLHALSQEFKTPPFIVLKKSDPIPNNLLSSPDSYMVRSCLIGEDSDTTSLAGQGVSFGPLPSSELESAVTKVFSQPHVLECIIQEFVQGQSGVIFCLSAECALLEYSTVPALVTSGKAQPFLSVFPNSLDIYQPIAAMIQRAFTAFGPCNLEFVGLQDPSFVQLRSITTPFSYDEDFCRLKMFLQELDDDFWIQDEFCIDLAECPDIDLSLIELFCEERQTLCDHVSLSVPTLQRSDFIKAGSQIFVSQKKANVPEGNWASWLSLGSYLFSEYRSLRLRSSMQSMSANELMRASIALRLLSGALERVPSYPGKKIQRHLFILRESYRMKLREKVAKSSLSSVYSFKQRLHGTIRKDSQHCTWHTIDITDSPGTVIVKGDFESGPYESYEKDMLAPKISCFLICDELYPEIYALFPYIKGIICEGGALTSHLSILAREHALPLLIQASRARERFL